MTTRRNLLAVSTHTSRLDNSSTDPFTPNSSDSTPNGSRSGVKWKRSVSSIAHLRRMTGLWLRSGFPSRKGVSHEYENVPNPNRNLSHISFRMRTSPARCHTRYLHLGRYVHHQNWCNSTLMTCPQFHQRRGTRQSASQ